MAEAKKRKANWTTDETLLLVQCIYDRKDVIRGRYGKTITSEDKKQAWAEVTMAVNRLVRMNLVLLCK